ncbi:MAG: hypothetical protein IMZ65_00220 [Planctomycetes bacterium]|nr:hypothetical protein [Planctomycetota bacterium]
MASRWATHCKSCGASVPAGGTVYWLGKGLGCRCEKCGPGSQAKPETPTATQPTSQPTRGGQSTRDSDNVFRYEFDGLLEAVQAARADTATSEENRCIIRRHMGEHYFNAKGEGPGDKWTNGYDYKRLEADAKNPPEHLLKAVDEMRAALVDEVAPPPTSRRRLRRGRDYGDDIDVDRFGARDPQMWNRIERERQPKRTVTIGVNLTVNCKQQAEELLWRGAAALALADAMTQRGINVAVTLFLSVNNPSSAVKRSVIRYQAKDPQQPLDVAGLTFAVCEIAWFRLVAATGQARLYPGTVCESLGGACDLPPADARTMDFLVEQTVCSRKAAEAWLRGAVGQFKESGNDSAAA